MSTIIEALKQAERESKNILSEAESTVISDGDSEEGKTASSGRKLVIFIALVAFSGAGAGGWYFFDTDTPFAVPSFQSVFVGKQTRKLVKKSRNLPVTAALGKGRKNVVNASFVVGSKKVERQIPSADNVVSAGKDKSFTARTISKTEDPLEVQREKLATYNASLLQNRRGIELYRDGKFQEAMDCFLLSIKLNSDLSEAHFNLALVFESMGIEEKAEKEYQRALGINPKFADAYINLGVIYNEANKYPQAKDAYEKVLDINPNDPTAHFNLGVLYAYYLNEPIKAIFHWKRYMHLEPGSKKLPDLKKAIEKIAST